MNTKALAALLAIGQFTGRYLWKGISADDVKAHVVTALAAWPLLHQNEIRYRMRCGKKVAERPFFLHLCHVANVGSQEGLHPFWGAARTGIFQNSGVSPVIFDNWRGTR